LGAGHEDAAGLPRDGAGMQLSRSQRRAQREFVEAVHAFFGDPCRANLERYLLASKELEKPYGGPIVRRAELAQAPR
jgi:hypothetical protein